MKKRLLILLPVIFILAGVFALVRCNKKHHPDNYLSENFLSPPKESKVWTWYHFQGENITKKGITTDFEAIKRVGIAGITLFHTGTLPFEGNVKFMSDKWWDLVKFSAREADRLGLEMAIQNCPGWATSGGPWISAENSMQQLVWSKKRIQGPAILNTESIPVPKNADQETSFFIGTGNPSQNYSSIKNPIDTFYRDIALLAVPLNNGSADFTDAKNVLILSEKDTLPAGEWNVYRFGHTTNGKSNNQAPSDGRGLECDKMSREAVELHFQAYSEKIIRNAGELAGKTLNMVVIDSYEARGRNDWTPLFREEFMKRRGYDPLPWLPVWSGITVGNKEKTLRFKADMKRTVEELILDNYYGFFRELSHEKGLSFASEPYGGTFNTIDAAGVSDLPMAEFFQKPDSLQEMGTFNDRGWHSIPEVVSGARLHGQAIIGAEAFTALPMWARWEQGPYELKATGDRAFCGGINQFHLHTYAHQPWENVMPGVGMSMYGMQFNRKQTWWEQSSPWFKYLERCQFLLQQGLFAGDVLFLGEGKISSGYAGDRCSEAVLLNRINVKNGRLVLPDGLNYSLLVLPDDDAMLPAVARKVKKLAESGAKIYAPEIPVRSPSLQDYPACDKEVREIFEELIAEEKLITGKTVEKALSDLGISPDVIVKGDPILWIHRRFGDIDMYFISNQEPKPLETQLSFRVEGPDPELWHPDKGMIEKCGSFSREEGRTLVNLKLDSRGSVFVVFPGKPTPGALPPQPDPNKVVAQIEGPWQVSFPSNWGAPQQITMNKLLSWPEHRDKGVKYFSGTATYEKEFDYPLSSSKRIWLDLGKVKNIAEVRLNGEDLGVLWKPPFRIEVSGLLKAENNKLEIDVTNYWRNRLIGDEQEPYDLEWGRLNLYPYDTTQHFGRGLLKLPTWVKENKPRPSPNKYTFTNWNHFLKDSQLLESGMLGPVNLICVE